MTIERRLQFMLAITLIFGVASVFTIIHISKGARFYQLNSEYIGYVNEFSWLLNRPASSPPSLHQVLEILYKIREKENDCLTMTNFLDRTAMYFIGTSHATSLCSDNIDQINEVINEVKKKIDINPGLIALDTAAKNRLIDIPDALRANSEAFERLISKTINFTITAALWFILPFSVIVFTLCYTIIRGVTRNAIEYRETAEALAESMIENRKLAYYDCLTQLPNRNLLSDRLEQTIRTAQRNNSSFALIFVDLDRFKHINDTLGHVAGDELIKQAAHRIKTSLRASDTLSRFGGDEFVIILPDLRAPADVSTVAKKMIEQVARPFNLEGVDTHVTASVGIAIYPENGEDISTLMKRADIAMYQSKDNGKNQFCYYNNEFNKEADKRLLLERDLRKAIDHDELVLHYQPVVELDSGRIVGVESLLRWFHGNEGLISPADFIPIAEDTGLIIDIGYKVLDMACRQCEIWRREEVRDFHVAVNVSARQLKEKDLVNRIQSILDKYSLPFHALDIEITESAFYNNDPCCIENLEKMEELGIRLLLDDFGTGFSSLSTLTSLPFDIIKIDKSFIQSQHGKNRKIAESILDLAQNFDMQVVAEGIEEQNVAGFLGQRGCKYGQGYLFQKPLPADELDLNRNFIHLITSMPELDLVSTGN